MDFTFPEVWASENARRDRSKAPPNLIGMMAHAFCEYVNPESKPILMPDGPAPSRTVALAPSGSTPPEPGTTLPRRRGSAPSAMVAFSRRISTRLLSRIAPCGRGRGRRRLKIDTAFAKGRPTTPSWQQPVCQCAAAGLRSKRLYTRVKVRHILLKRLHRLHFRPAMG